MLIRMVLVRAIMLAVMWAMVSQAYAQALAIVPIRQNLSSDHRSASFKLTNTSESSALVQIRCYRWVQKGNDDTFLPTSNLIISPTFATIGPGKSQTVRLLLRTVDENDEQSYRVVFDQIPDHVGNKVQLTLRFSVPVFASNSVEAKSDVQFRIEREGDKLVLVAANRGSSHSILSKITASTKGGEVLQLTGPSMPYILAGNEHRWDIRKKRNLLNMGSRIHVVNLGPQNELDQWVSLGPEN
ncbi:fimbrial biogenesis chaperone [Hafnia psychrotolerans]|uniref:Pilus assembly protein n=1 Tax=Hafnia psychrotolerans TaxID=1477018 RepID=A0ABQ1GFS2_9GAMM|nr:fimbria/pilus periplasmic chaperone [Hafnia psychrotolerans]GGA42947.1 pilus assembly protein [Hafnia psychrotolerans]